MLQDSLRITAQNHIKKYKIPKQPLRQPSSVTPNTIEKGNANFKFVML